MLNLLQAAQPRGGRGRTRTRPRDGEARASEPLLGRAPQQVAGLNLGL